MLIDSCARTIDYLRLSVTDLCNIRCRYCMPADRVLRKHRSEILTFEETGRLVTLLAQLGIRKVRLTGGEPLLRKGIVDLVRRLNNIEGIEEVLMTTNGLFLKKFARSLKEAGLYRINVHLDTLDSSRFSAITRGGDLSQVHEGLKEAKEIGLNPIKLNCVVQKGINDDEIEEMIRFSADNGFILRLIELMPLGPAVTMISANFISLEEIGRRLEEKYERIPFAPKLGSGPAKYYRIMRKRGPIFSHLLGFISPLSQSFCKNCSRIRLSSDGVFQGCLAFEGTVSLKTMLRDPATSDTDLLETLKRLVKGKRTDHHNFAGADRAPCMYGIGG